MPGRSRNRSTHPSMAMSRSICPLNEVDAGADLDRPEMRPEQRAGTRVLFQQTAYRQADGFGLVAMGQPVGRLFDQGYDIGPADGDDVCHELIITYVLITS